ncbi:MAG: glycosyltransferase family 2 protein [Prevotella sp.]|nr:glycosyltransferase family 2 protein [Prevotella sp.]
MNKLTVVIISYRVPQYLEQCIVSVRRATEGIDSEIIVVDNHSDDGTVEYLKERFGKSITLIESNHNLGFSKANNIAIRQSTSEYVLLLNPDTFVAEDSIKTVLQFMDEHPNVGGAGVMMHNANGTAARESRRGIPTPYVSLLKMLGNSSRYYLSHLPWDEPGRIDVMSGAFCLLRREALARVGLLDEEFFMYGEDIDLSYRILKGGYENWYVPAHIVHYKGESTQKSSFRYVHVFYQAMLIFFRKHYGHLSLLVTLPIKVAIYGRAFIALLQMQYRRLRNSLGLIDPQAEDFEYVFVGSQQMLDECQKLARQKGLMATFLHKGDELPAGREGQCIVYDTDAFTYGQIIDMAARDGKSETGTYNCSTKTLITSREVIR